MRKLLLLCFFLPSIIHTTAQNASIKGKIIDSSTKEAIIGATAILDNGKGAVSDLDGNYLIQTPPGTYTLTVKFIGYEDFVKNISVNESETKVLDILLVEGNQLEDVVVSASKFEQNIGEVPVSMAVIKPKLIDSKATITPESIVDQIPGVQVMENQVSIRGGSGFSYGSGSRVLLMVDDIPMLAGDANDVKWPSLPLENLAQMEVIKGASSVLYGSSALNGVINMRTAYPTDKPKTKINISNGVYGHAYGTQLGRDINGNDTILNRDNQTWWNGTQYYVSGNFLHSRRIKDNFDLVVGGNFLTDEGYRAGADEHRFRINANTRWRSKKFDGLTYGVNVSHTNGRGNLFFLWQNGDSVLIPQGGLDTATTTLSAYSSYRTNIDPFITYFDSTGRKHSLRGRFYSTENVNNTNQGSQANSYYAEYQFQQRYKHDYTLTAGLMEFYTGVHSELYGDHESNNLAIFAQGDKKLNRFNFTAGMRVEHFRIDTVSSRTASKLLKDTIPVKPVFRFGATYQAAEATYLRASYGEGYRFPSIAEKYISTFVGGLNVFPNPQVQPETGWSAELGIKQGFKISNFKGYLDVAGFVTEYHDMMEFRFGFYTSSGQQWDYASMGYPGLVNFGAQSRNVSNARISGAEATIVGTGNIGKIGVNVLAGYTYINPVSLNSDSLYRSTFSDSVDMLKYRYKHMAKADLELTYKSIALGASGRYNSFMQNVDKSFVDALGELILPGYAAYRDARRIGDFVMDARFSFKFTETSKLAFLVNNVFNREYSNRPGNILPPRTYIVQYSFNF